ncbi:prolipoprotein diacylglyceryl transferase [Corynebacterium mendelii]|uniref:Phosphatidylglycerol--prolipoprotein diacylglyceryl transferase n=1 Tax=Corynebacterium mendelii TaxID=2765362 RepID=A0A939E139_9CORY|nr:prolipoprotein diacylglyceryl transferase [Corynebacterium mendelii]MBN9643602.1 prolipoprotein diacylglyceryl transferase [Corynebacterium mendelii]
MTTTFLAMIPSPPQGVWHIGPVPLRAYALCIITGVIAAAFVTRARYAARGGMPEIVMDAVIIAVPAGIVGGRAYHVATDHQKYFCDTCHPVDAFKVTNGGLGIMGAVALGVLCVWIMMRVRNLPLAPLADAAAPAIILAQGIGRLGNWFNQELYGRETTVPWGLEIYQRITADGQLSQMYGHSTGQVIAVVHPTFLYELVWNICVCAVLILVDKRFTLGHGRVFALYVALYGVGRFWVELMRADPATHVMGLRINTITSTILVIAGCALFMLLKKGREQPDEVTPPEVRARLEAARATRTGSAPATTPNGTSGGTTAASPTPPGP